MKKKFLVTGICAMLWGQAFAFFSAHVILTPGKLEHHEDFKVWLYSSKDDPDMVNVVLPFHRGYKKYWLFSSTRELKDEELNFRDSIWRSYRTFPDYIRTMARIAPPLDENGSAPEGAFIRLKIRRDVLKETYIYHDFDQAVDDGGWYRTYRLSAFPVGTGIDPIMELEWEISRYKRLGKNTEHREAERKLREMVADEKFMAKWGTRYTAELEAARKEDSE